MGEPSFILQHASIATRIFAAFLGVAAGMIEPGRCGAAQGPAPESSLVKLLKSGRVPEARLGTIMEMIAKRGTADDLTFLYERALSAGGLAAPLRSKALEVLAEAASNRNLRPVRDLERIVPLVRADSSRSGTAVVMAATRLAGLWKLEAAGDALGALAASPSTSDSLRAEALLALSEIGGKVGRSRIEALTAPGQPMVTRLAAIAAMAALDQEAAAQKAAEILAQPAEPGRDLSGLLAAFLNRQGGGATLAAAIARQNVPADSARLVLRAVYGSGRADASLVAALSRAAGISAVTKALAPDELKALVADVTTKGDPARGELIFRRPDLNCMSCHSLSKAGGEVGPDLSSIGQTSPPDYIINAILDPDQSIKEQYHTLLVLTNSGQIFQGIVTDKDDQRIVLKEATGPSRIVPVATIEDQKPGGSLMPKGLANLMTRSELVDLVRFLSELGKPGPFAIPAKLAIQRWRVLKPVHESSSGSVPDADPSLEQALQAGSERWMSVYAKVAGALPLDELAAMTNRGVLFLQGEINVTAAGAIRFQLDSAEGARVWIDGEPARAGARAVTKALAAGMHAITIRIDMPGRKFREVKVEVDKPAGSTAEFTVIGGR
jgi:putative heme-binding domain-containing protein